jgi:hypothetical protein
MSSTNETKTENETIEIPDWATLMPDVKASLENADWMLKQLKAALESGMGSAMRTLWFNLPPDLERLDALVILRLRIQLVTELRKRMGKIADAIASKAA